MLCVEDKGVVGAGDTNMVDETLIGDDISVKNSLITICSCCDTKQIAYKNGLKRLTY